MSEISEYQSATADLDPNRVASAYNDVRARSESVDSAQTAVSSGFRDSPDKVETWMEEPTTRTSILPQSFQSTNVDYVSKTFRKSSSTQQINAFSVLRLLLMGAMLLIIAGEVALYFLVRHAAAFYKQRVSLRGKAGRLRMTLQKSQSYDEYMKIARELDRYLENSWAEGKYYDAALLRRTTQMLCKARTQAEKAAAERKCCKEARVAAIALGDALRQGALRANAGGWENNCAWAQTYAEPAQEVDEYVAEAAASISIFQASQHLSTTEKRSVLRQVARQQGRTALCLSGGAAMGWKHLGVVRGLLDAGCLPRAVSGASAGALMAALVGTHTDAELRRILRPELAKYMTACQGDFWGQARRWMRFGHWFDAIEWAPRTQVFTRGSLTFEEAYARTGRVLSIAATPQNPRHAQGQLLNYMTTPNVVIWSAVLASASLPGAVQPVVLLAKNRNGQLVPYADSGVEWRDGSFCSDVPRNSLKTLLNVQFTIASQVNPHVTLFLYARNGAVGLPVHGWQGRYLAATMEHMLKLDICKWLRLLSDLHLTPPCQQDWARVWLQRFDGSVTILPYSHLGEYLHLARDPTPASLSRSIHVGRAATWSALRLIQARMAIENAITDAWINVCSIKGQRLCVEDLWTG
ncbi:hypothetical protein H4R20_000250 [Coemansia guatemalensis]|uniref:PNPLA domain-containing protein n=1 Tax=Coemansia guatemalensis TaxID=2761395 RepID=A0A9W8I5K9_9FUNG|nr:hypothetical protein H4R20_000250 [Coemansia guatemalensis]